MQKQYNIFGVRLRQIREKMGLSQEEFGSIFGITKQAISRYERSERSPKLTVAVEFANKLNVSLSYLAGKSDE